MARQLHFIALLLLGALSVAAHADEENVSSADSMKPLGFLELGSDYKIYFPDSHNWFRHVARGAEVMKSGPTSWRVETSVVVFTVRGRGEGAWVLLEHPESVEDDATKWNLMKLAKHQLTAERVKKLEATDDGRVQLKAFRSYEETASIKTTKTWVNLNQAIAIAEIPSTLDVNAVIRTASQRQIPRSRSLP